MYRTSEEVYQTHGYSSHQIFVNALLILAQAEDTDLFPIEQFNTISSPYHSTDVDKTCNLLTSTANTQSYNTFSPETSLSCDVNHGEYGSSNEDNERISPHLVNRLSCVESVAWSGDIEAATDEDSCIICYSNRGDVCLMNCGHGGICFDCASTVVTERSKLCPVCRSEITQILHVNPIYFWLKKGLGIFYSDSGYVVVEERTHVGDT